MTSWSNSHTLYWQHLATSRCLVLKLSTFDSRLVVAMKYNQIWYDMIDKAFILNHWLSAVKYTSTFRSDVSYFCSKSKVQGVLRGYLAKASVYAFLRTSSIQFIQKKRMNSWLDRADSISEAYQRGSKKFQFPVSDFDFWNGKMYSTQFEWFVFFERKKPSAFSLSWSLTRQ